MKKEIKTRYANKTINKNFYSEVKVKPGDEGIGYGYIFAPYVLKEHTEESLTDYNKFMDEYRKLHKLCPKCGVMGHSTTLMGYPLIEGKRDEYKDLNNCVCSNCGNHHTTHERISEEEFNKKIIQ